MEKPVGVYACSYTIMGLVDDENADCSKRTCQFLEPLYSPRKETCLGRFLVGLHRLPTIRGSHWLGSFGTRICSPLPYQRSASQWEIDCTRDVISSLGRLKFADWYYATNVHFCSHCLLHVLVTRIRASTLSPMKSPYEMWQTLRSALVTIGWPSIRELGLLPILGIEIVRPLCGVAWQGSMSASIREGFRRKDYAVSSAHKTPFCLAPTRFLRNVTPPPTPSSFNSNEEISVC